jgi:DNA-binding CsgD family transcriptional regulator
LLLLEYGDCLHNISEVYFSLNRTEKTLEYLKASLNVYRKLNNTSRLAKGARSMGSIYYSNEMYEQALESYFEVLKYYRSAKNDDIYIVYLNIGATYFTLNEFEKGVRFLKLAEKECLFALETNPSNSVVRKVLSIVYYNKAYYFHSIMEDEKAYLSYLHKSIDVLENLYTPESDAPLLKLHRLYGEKGEFNQAYKYLTLHQNIHDSLFNIEKTTQINELEYQYATYKQQQENELKKRKTELKYWMALSGMLFLLIIILIVLNRQKNKTKKVQLEKQGLVVKGIQLESQINVKDKTLSKKEKELKNLATKIIEKDKSIGKLQDYVNKVNTSLMDKVKHLNINELLMNTRKSIEIEKDRKEFLLSIEQVSIPFFKKLDNEYEGLTKHQKRLAALVKHGFTAKEISIIFNISPKAAQTGKYRLKKKLNLTAEQDLEEFIMNY